MYFLITANGWDGIDHVLAPGMLKMPRWAESGRLRTFIRQILRAPGMVDVQLAALYGGMQTALSLKKAWGLEGGNHESVGKRTALCGVPGRF